MPKKKDVAQRFWAKVEVGPPEDCWPWIGAWKLPFGYGKFYLDGKNHSISSHRMVYTLTYGQIPKGMCVRHSCDNAGCCNPNHLSLGSQAQNMEDRNTRKRHAWGEKVNLSKLTVEQVTKIRQLYAVGGQSHRKLAKLFDVTAETILDILQRNTWKEI